MTTNSEAAGLLTIKNVCAIAGVTSMTVYNWRAGVRTDKTKLHFLRMTSGRNGEKRTKVPGVRFRAKKFLEWADRNGVPLDLKELKRLNLDTAP